VAEFLIWACLIIVVVAVLIVPVWTSRRKRRLSGKLEQYQTIAEALLESDLPRAREGLKSLIRSDTEDVAAYLRLARILKREGDLERSVALYRSLKARDIRDATIRQQVAAGLTEDLFELERYDEARTAAAELKALDRRHPLVRQVELHEALEAEDWSRALKAVDGIVRSGRGSGGPRPSQVRTLIAARRDAAGQAREARRLLEDALRDEPDYGPALLLLGDLQSRGGEHERATESWKRLLRAHPAAAPSVIARLEKAYFEMGRFSDLGTLYEELSAAAPERSSALELGRVRMALRRGEPGEALRIVDELLERQPGDRPARDWRHFLLLEAGNTAGARAGLKELAEGSLAEPESPACPQCGHRNDVLDVRCTNCRAWQPDPFARPAGARQVASS
jgi:lipopolysaccharide biosynthesis regulator YciM